MADLFRILTLDGQVVGIGVLVALVWLVVTVNGLDTRVANLSTDVGVLRGRQVERDQSSVS